MLSGYFSVICAFVTVVSGDESAAVLEENARNETSTLIETTTFKYPTATWSAKNYEMKRKKYDPEMMVKLFLFKPSPFLKPPFTDGSVGSSITTIDDSVNVSGRRRGKIKTDKTEKVLKKPIIEKLEPKESRRVDLILEHALMNYIRSANLTDEFGTITVEEFSEALRRVTENRKNSVVYEENRDMRRKFRDDVLTPKRIETTTSNGILEKQYQRRLQKTWDIISENISTPSRFATLDRRVDWEMGKPSETQPEPTTMQYLFSHITSSTPSMTTASDDFYGDSPPSETTQYREDTASKPEIERVSEKFRVSETGWRDVATPTIPSIVSTEAEWLTSKFDTSEISLTTKNPADEIPTTFRPNYSSEKKKPKKGFRGKKKWRDTVPAAQEIRDWDDGEVKLSVAETVYYRPRQNALESFKLQPTVGAIPGEPERDYPMLSTPPSTGFKCPKINGDTVMVADREARCQAFYICTGDGPPAPMLCPNGTLFNENVLVCDWWYNVDC